ncbi:MAG TPA: xylulokinase [Dongiaceae bacterium]|nr:xylulokinase [Dongiaceae bacterium]
MTHFLGLDIGTSAVKGVLVDEGQHIVASATGPIATAQPRPGWSEQAPEDWWRAVEATAAEIAQAAPQAWREIKAIGLSGQMHGLVPIDAAGAPVRPAILWNDGRAAAEAAELAANVPDMTLLGGVLPMAGLTAPKALWMARHQPALFARAACFLLPKDYVRLHLTGQRLTDVSDAAGTLWLDQAARAWSPALIAASGLRPDQVPPIVEGPVAAGHLLPAIAQAWNLPGETLVVGGGGDATLGAIGIGAVHDGDAFISIGTSAQYYVTRDCYVPSGPEGLIHNFAQALPRTWSQMAALLNGAGCLTWAAGIFGDGDIVRALAEVEAGYKGPGNVMFLPYLAGERTPHNDPSACGMFAQLSHATSRTDLFQAVLEGVGYALVDAQDALRGVGAEADHLAIVGGGVRSRFWVRLLASMLGKDLTLYDGADRGPAFGAARLARLGFTGESVAEVCSRPPVLEVIEPEPNLSAAYAERQPHFRALYQATRKLRA